MHPSIAAITFALETDSGLEFLRYWTEGEFDVIRENWPDCPADVFVGAEVEPNTLYFYRAQAYSVECPQCEYELTGLMGDPSGKSIECEECKHTFSVSKGATPIIF